MQVFQQQQQRPLQRSKQKPKPKGGQERREYAAAAAAMMIFACSVAAACAAQQVAVSGPYSLGTWSTAALSAARGYLAATSLPNLGVAIFAGGLSMCNFCHVDFRIFACGLLCEGDA